MKLGAYILPASPGDTFTPYIAGYLLIMGIVIVLKAFREFPPRKVTRHLVPLGFCGAFLDAIGGGGWGASMRSSSSSPWRRRSPSCSVWA